MPLVSVIIPNYCHSGFLEQRIRSVLDQSFHDFEIILMDDASPDDGKSKVVLEKYRNNEKVTAIVYNKRNSGSVFKQWHKGIEMASGEWVWIAESDDFCDSDLLERLIGETDDSTVIAYCASLFVDEKGEKMDNGLQSGTGCPIRYDGKTFIRKRMSYGNAIWNASSAIFRKDIAKALDPEYTEFQAAGDRLFWIGLAEHGDVVHIPEGKNYFRQHNMKVSPSKKSDGTTMREDKAIFDYLVERGYISQFRKWTVTNRYLDDIEADGYEASLKRKLKAIWPAQTSLSRLLWVTVRRIRAVIK